MGNNILYAGGLPTGPDVKKLEAKYPDIRALRGTTIRHEDIEVTIGVWRGENRYKTVVDAWRRSVRKNTGIVIRGDISEVVGIGYRVLSDAEQVEYGVDERRGAGRKIRSSYSAFSDVDESKLTDEQRRIRDHGMLAGRHIHAAMIESRKFIAETTAPPEQKPARPETEKKEK